MSYQIEELLNKCEIEDYTILVELIDNYFSYTDDSKLKLELEKYKKSHNKKDRILLNQHIEKNVRYFGSADVAYFRRYLFHKDQLPGVNIDEIIRDVSKLLKVKQRHLGTVEARLERLTKAVAENTFFKLTSKQQRDLFNKAGLSGEQQKEFFKKIKDNKVLFFPILLSIIGSTLLREIMTGIVVKVITKYSSKKAAEKIVAEITKKIPWWSEWLGPIVWALSIGWLMFDMQGPANRKTVPILLYLGIVGLRDGPEEGENFWKES